MVSYLLKKICFTEYSISIEPNLLSFINGNIIKTFMRVNEILFL
jgi:hypothetical protein